MRATTFTQRLYEESNNVCKVFPHLHEQSFQGNATKTRVARCLDLQVTVRCCGLYVNLDQNRKPRYERH